MHTIPATKYSEKQLALMFLASSILLTLFLSFMDEGYYNFKWMTEVGNWVVFGIYTMVLFVSQTMVAYILKRLNVRQIMTYSSVGGLLIGLLFLFTILG